MLQWGTVEAAEASRRFPPLSQLSPAFRRGMLTESSPQAYSPAPHDVSCQAHDAECAGRSPLERSD